ncbi:hypothetical protein FRB95_013117 [Tulasnella sp. JGI-2019a]|nr:hypothetical protein FRB95_013117 [Tulasnella sp. JGI-2019a]
MPSKRPKNAKKKKVKKATAAISGQDNQSSEGESDAGDQQVNLVIDDEPGPVKWKSDIELTDSLVSHLHDNQELRQAIIPHGDLRKADEDDHSKDKSFFKLAQHLFGGNTKYEGLAKGIDLAENESDIREYAKLVEERWRQVVGMTRIADDAVGDDLKGIRDEKDIEAMDGGEVKSKIENIKATHPWYFKIRSFLPREPSSSADPTDTAPVQGTAAASTEEQTTEPQGELSSKTPIDESELAATTPSNDTPPALSGTPQVVTAKDPNNRVTESIAAPSPTAQQIDSPEKTVREELGVQDDLGQDTTQKDQSGGEREGADTQSIADVTCAFEEEMVAPAPIIAIIVPLPGEVTDLAAPQAERPISSSVDGRSEQPTSPTLWRLTSSPRLIASGNRVQVAVESPITVEVDGLITASTRRTISLVPIISIGPTTASDGRSLESCAAERRNRCSIYDMYETWDAIHASGETGTPSIHSNPTHEPTTVGVDQVESHVPIIPDGSTSRLEQAFEVAQSRPDSPVPGNLKAVVPEISSTLQAGPLVTTPSTDCEAGDRATREQPSYSVEKGIVPTSPSGCLNYGCGYTGNSVSQEKSGDEKHIVSAPRTSEAHKTPHTGSGFDTASKHDATPPEKEMVELGVTPVLERIEGAERAGVERVASPVCVPTSERVLRVLSVGAPRRRPIEVTPNPTVQESARHPRNKDPASHSFMTTSQTGLSSAMEGMASTARAASVPSVPESSATGAKQAGTPLSINLSGAPHGTARATDQKPGLGRPRIIYQEKDFFKRTIRSSVQPQAPRSELATPPIPAPRPKGLSCAATPASPPGPPPESSAKVPSHLQAVEPTGSTMFPMEEIPGISQGISIHHTASTPMAVVDASVPRPTTATLDSRPGSVSLSSNERELPTIQPLASSGGRTRSYPEYRSMAPILTDVTVLDVAAHAANKLDESNEDGSRRRRASTEQQYPHSSGVAASAVGQMRGSYHPFVSMTEAAVYLPQARPSVTFEFPNQLDGPGGMESKGAGGGTGPAPTASASPALRPVGVVLSPPSRSNLFGSESTVRQIQSTPMDRYDQDRRDRERAREWERGPVEEWYGLTQGRQWDDDRSVSTSRVRYASSMRSDKRGIYTIQHRDTSPARPDEVECVCSSCRNAWCVSNLLKLSVSLGVDGTYLSVGYGEASNIVDW